MKPERSHDELVALGRIVYDLLEELERRGYLVMPCPLEQDIPPARPRHHRRCLGFAGGQCEKPAIFVCTERRAPGSTLPPLQWFACELREHIRDGTTEPIDEWFARNNLEDAS